MSRARYLLEMLFGKKITLSVMAGPSSNAPGQTFSGLISRNTIPGERSFRVSWFYHGDPEGHIDISQGEANLLLKGIVTHRLVKAFREECLYAPIQIIVK